MQSLSNLLDAIRREPNRQMAWDRIASNHIIGTKTPTPFDVNNDYVVVKLASMFLKNSRVLWLKLSPLAHAAITMTGRTGPQEQTAIIGPAQFGDLAAAPADRTIVLHQRLAGPTVWRGGDLQVSAGLFAVPKDEAAGALLDTLGQLSGLAIPGLEEGVKIARVVKSGIEGIIGLKGTQPVLGVKVGLGDPTVTAVGSEAAPCILAAIAAPATDVKFESLWVRDGRLMEGPSPDALSVYERNDFLLVAIEKGPPRQDYRGLRSLAPHEGAFNTILRKPDILRPDAEAELNAAFHNFDQDLSTESELTEPDKNRIRGEIIADLKDRIVRKFGGPFGPEQRSVGGIQRRVDPEGFNFLDVGDRGAEFAKPAEPGALPF